MNVICESLKDILTCRVEAPIVKHLRDFASGMEMYKVVQFFLV